MSARIRCAGGDRTVYVASAVSLVGSCTSVLHAAVHDALCADCRGCMLRARVCAAHVLRATYSVGGRVAGRQYKLSEWLIV